ncbi:MAG: DUF6689 family protein [Tahibacter sp.]
MTAAALLALVPLAPAVAQVVVTVSGDTAYAQIALTGPLGQPYDADVTIQFDTPQHLTPGNLNLTAQVISPLDPVLVSRLPAGTFVDPAFPVLITIEPLNLPWLFKNGFDNLDAGGNLSFINTYQIDVHTADLECQPNTPYRLFKAPLGGAFFDLSADVRRGSVRGRGRGGGFSQFMLIRDPRLEVISVLGINVPVIALAKVTVLETRIIAAALNNVLQLNLLGLLANVQTALLVLDYTTALLNIDQLIDQIHLHAGVDLPNQWRAERDLTNDAGDIEGLAASLRYSILRLQSPGACPL